MATPWRRAMAEANNAPPPPETRTPLSPINGRRRRLSTKGAPKPPAPKTAPKQSKTPPLAAGLTPTPRGELADGATLAVFGAAGFGAPLAESLRRRPLIGESGVRVSGGGGGALLASAIARRQGVVILVALLRSEHFARARVTLYAAARRVRVRLVHCHAA